MRNKFFQIIILLIISFSLLSCSLDDDVYKGPSIDFGVATYYEPFLFSKSDTLILSRTLNFDFNDYAEEKASHINISIADKDRKVINNDNFRFFIDNIYVPNNEFSIHSEDRQKGKVEIGIQFLPDYPNGIHRGFLQITGHSLDVVNHYDLNLSDETRLFEWVATQKTVMNPLKKWLLWIGVILVSLVLIWLIILRPIVYNRFGRGTLIVQSPYFNSIKLYKAIGLTLCSQPAKQNWKARLFKGKEIAHNNPFFTVPIRVTPHSRNNIRIQLGTTYTITPFTTTLTRGHGQYTITNSNTKQKITITYS